jgi:hypothetical protein
MMTEKQNECNDCGNKSAQGRQQLIGSLEVGRVGALRELLEHRLQQQPGGFALSLIGTERCEIARGAQVARG